MERGLPVWRRIGAALAAVVLAVLVFGPGLDGLLCLDEAGLSAAAAEMAYHGDDAPAEPGACLHGHCHHGVSEAPPARAGHAAPAGLIAGPHAPGRDRVATSDPKFGVLRPPRA